MKDKPFQKRSIKERFEDLTKWEKFAFKEELIIAFQVSGSYAYQNVYRIINETRKLNKKELSIINKIFDKYE
jgi:hypothetical protein